MSYPHPPDSQSPSPAVTVHLDLPEASNAKSSVNHRKIEKRLLRETGRAIEDFRMIEDGDSIMVCLSGGKDSYTMLNLLLRLQAKAPVDFRLVAVNLDQKQPDFPAHILPEYLSGLGVDWKVIERDTYSTVKRVVPEGKTMCGLCSRLRRGTLYGYAEEHGFNKIALGHHRDDIIETFFLNLFHGGSLKAMPPKLRSDSGKNIVIRPLAYCRERDIEQFAHKLQFPIIPCNLCGSQSHLQRAATKKMLREWERQHPGRVESIFRALSNVSPSQLVDRELFDFNTFSRKAEKASGQKTEPTGISDDAPMSDSPRWSWLSANR